MSLLFDENLSHRLVGLLAIEYPGSEHVRQLSLASAADQDIWSAATARGLIVVSKDADFQHRALLFGPPAKVIWLRIGNGPTAAAEALLRARRSDVLAFVADPVASLLVLP
jgi:predicted nuclease of predicted toxin-antitoxin system